MGPEIALRRVEIDYTDWDWMKLAPVFSGRNVRGQNRGQ